MSDPDFKTDDERIVNIPIANIIKGYRGTIPNHPSMPAMISRKLVAIGGIPCCEGKDPAVLLQFDENVVYEFETKYKNFLNYDFGGFVMRETFVVDGLGEVMRFMENKNHTNLFKSIQTVKYSRNFLNPDQTKIYTTMDTWGKNIAIRGLIYMSKILIQTKFEKTIDESLATYRTVIEAYDAV